MCQVLQGIILGGSARTNEANQMAMLTRLDRPSSLPVPPESREKVRIHHDFDRRRIKLLSKEMPLEIGYLCYDSSGTSAHISLVVVNKPFRRAGYSKLLLNNALTHMFFAGIREVTLFCYPLDEIEVGDTWLGDIYQNYGFVATVSSTGPDRYLTPLYATHLSGT
jgi:hypothetical protein